MEKVRNRLVNFRVTEEEFQRVKAASTLNHARCVSDYARSAVLRNGVEGADPGEAHVSLDHTLRSFDQRLALLESNVARLIEALTSSSLLSAKSES